MIQNSPLFLLFFLSIALQTLGLQKIGGSQGAEKWIGRRALLSFKETPPGSNTTYDCGPSGPCVPCLYSEKNDEKYRCSETGYRIPLKCIEIKDNTKDTNRKSSYDGRSNLETFDTIAKSEGVLYDARELSASLRHRSVLHDETKLENGPQAYTTYRSCIPAVIEEKISVFGFEAIVLCLLLISGSVVYFRRKRTVTMTGVGGGRIQTSSRALERSQINEVFGYFYRRKRKRTLGGKKRVHANCPNIH